MNVTIENVSKAFGGNDLFTDFSLDIDSGTRLCICGPNGCGKSTLLRLIIGDEQVDAGKIILPKNCRVGYVEQELDEESLQVPLLEWVQSVLPDWRDFWIEWDNAIKSDDKATISRLNAKHAELEQVYGYNPEHRAQAVLSGLGFEQDKWNLPLKLLSGGWRERAKLARILTAGADVLLLDEPTNHLDIEAVEWLESFLMNYQGVLIFVAHDRVFMDKVGTHVLYLGGSKPLFRKMSFSKFMELFAELEEQKEREVKRLNEEIERKMDFVRRFSAKATKARQAGSRQKMAKKLGKELENIKIEPKQRELSFKMPEPSKADKVIFAVADLAFQFEDGVSLWDPLNFNIFNGQRIAFVGHNGVGKSTILKILAGKLEKKSGSLVSGSLVKLGYYSQHQAEILTATNTVLTEMRRLSDPRTTEEELKSVLGLFMLGREYFERFVNSLSGGEKARLVLASLFLAKCNVLVLDEPTNHLDLESREALVEALSDFSGTIILVAHDRYLLSQIIDEFWEVKHGGITVYDSFIKYDEARRKSIIEKPVEQNAVSSNLNREDLKKLKHEQAQRRNLLYKKLKPLQDKYAKKEKEFEILIEEQQELEHTLSLQETYENGENATEKLKMFNDVKNKIDIVVEEMSALEEEIEEINKEYQA